MGKKGGGGGSNVKPAVASSAGAGSASADAAKKLRAKVKQQQKGKLPGGVASVVVLAVAVAATVLFTRNPSEPPRPPTAEIVRDQASVQDEAFRPQDTSEQCASWARDGECANSELSRKQCPRSSWRKLLSRLPDDACVPLSAASPSNISSTLRASPSLLLAQILIS
mmetsp:Transcript_33970/g.89352  ORF Transcript_33970/g.89352 Transcript_33970/m.89352 type:complete len:167 (-) Transcript_33970:1956-2456(-)